MLETRTRSTYVHLEHSPALRSTRQNQCSQLHLSVSQCKTNGLNFAPSVVIELWQISFAFDRHGMGQRLSTHENIGYVSPHAESHVRFPLPSIGVVGVACIDLAKKLELYENQIGDIGAEKLATALLQLTNLTVAWLQCCVWASGAPRCTMRAWLLLLESRV